ncbi:MAG: sigma-70 family RNA polymerase sigma factor, partial [Ekhidna sp.]|nr:sigma-70 family RNA polymerase sigma factor [Ekhidna sp.]
MTIQHLIQESRSGDRNAQQLLYKQLSAPMMGICLRYMKNQEDAEDVLLEGFFKVFKNLGKFVYENDQAFFGWVKRIMVNESLMKLRKNRDIQIMAINEEFEKEIELSPLSDLEAADLLELIRSIPVGYRTVFNLYEVEGYSHQEIAEKLSISVGTSKSQLFKAKKLLRELLNEKH